MSAHLDVDRLRADTPGCASCHSPQQRWVGPAARRRHRHGRRPPAARGADRRVRGARRGGRPDRGASAARPPPSSGRGRSRSRCVESATAAWSRAFRPIAFTRRFNAGRPHPRVVAPSTRPTSCPCMQLSHDARAPGRVHPRRRRTAASTSPRSRDLLDADVAVVAVTHCPSQNGLDQRRRRRSARSLRSPTPGTSSTRASPWASCPSTSTAIGADFLSATGRKFLRGPRGTGFLYASDRALDELEPFPLDLHSATWTSRRLRGPARPHAASSTGRSRTRRVLGMGAAIDYALDCGIEAIARAHRRARAVRPRADSRRSPGSPCATGGRCAAAS